MEAHGASVNVGSFLGGNNVRQYAKGTSQGPASPAELDSMRTVVRWAMEGGAFGIATALIYPPATFASTEELIEALEGHGALRRRLHHPHAVRGRRGTWRPWTRPSASAPRGASRWRSTT
jgi:N-acyl-D-aspartate/D-glutamate deacylase